MIVMIFSERLKKLRADKGITQEQLANALDIPASTVRRLEVDKEGGIPRKERLESIADYFGVSVDYLLGRTNEKNKVLSDKAREFIDDLELTDEEFIMKHNLLIDGIPLTKEQAAKFIRYVRAERDLGNLDK